MTEQNLELQNEEKKIADDFAKELLNDVAITESIDVKSVESNDTIIELTDFEKEQQNLGWNPKGPKSAEQWHQEKPLREEISKRGRYVKKLEKTIEELKRFMDKQEQHSYQKALSDLTSKKEAAISLGDSNVVHQIDEQIKNIPKPTPSEHPALSEFKERNNKWFEGTSYDAMKITDFAKLRDSQLAAKGLPIEEHLALLEEHIHREFPNYFNKENNSSKNYSAVESANLGSNSVQKFKKVWTFKDLSSEQKNIAEEFDKHKIMKKEDYIKALVEMGELHE